MSESWADGMRTMHGIHVHGFPNAFLVQPFTGGMMFPNLPHNLSEAAKNVAAVVAHARGAGADLVEVTRPAQDAWMDQVGVDPEFRSFLADCTPGYLNHEGTQLGPYSLFDEFLGHDALEFFQHLHRWRENRDFDGLTFTHGGGRV